MLMDFFTVFVLTMNPFLANYITQFLRKHILVKFYYLLLAR